MSGQRSRSLRLLRGVAAARPDAGPSTTRSNGACTADGAIAVEIKALSVNSGLRSPVPPPSGEKLSPIEKPSPLLHFVTININMRVQCSDQGARPYYFITIHTNMVRTRSNRGVLRYGTKKE